MTCGPPDLERHVEAVTSCRSPRPRPGRSRRARPAPASRSRTSACRAPAPMRRTCRKRPQGRVRRVKAGESSRNAPKVSRNGRQPSRDYAQVRPAAGPRGRGTARRTVPRGAGATGARCCQVRKWRVGGGWHAHNRGHDTSTPTAATARSQAHDARFDGRFFVGVSSTRIYCRPVCTVRTPRRENCRFFTSAAAAEVDGFRPCLRCRPELAPGMASVDATRAARAGAPST